MVDRKSTLETAKSVQPVLAILQKPSTIRKNRSNDSDEECSIGALRKLQESIWWRHLLAGGLAGATSRTITAPLDRVKIYTQVHKHSMNLTHTLKFLVQQSGVFSLWRGNSVNVLKIMPESATKFTTYEKIKRLIRGEELRELGIHERFIAGAAAGGIAQTCVFPLEVLKVRLALTMSDQVEGIRYIARNMYLNEGVRSFYRGYLPNIMGSVPYGGIELTIYETLKRHYRSYLPLGEDPSLVMLSVCSGISTIIGQCCVYPFSLVRTRFQSGRLGNAKLFETFRQIILNEGPRGLYRGLTTNICKVVPSVSINFVMYEYVGRNLGIYMS